MVNWTPVVKFQALTPWVASPDEAAKLLTDAKREEPTVEFQSCLCFGEWTYRYVERV